jgi:hypothetical protein
MWATRWCHEYFFSGVMDMMRKQCSLYLIIGICAFSVLPLMRIDLGNSACAQPASPSGESQAPSEEMRVSPPVSSPASAQTLSEAATTSPSESEEVIELGAISKMVGGPKADLGKEYEEPKAPLKLFKNQEDIERLLGGKPRFVYDPKELPDPMIIPWVRRDVMVREMLDTARKHVATGNLPLAKELLRKALADFPDSRLANQVRDEMKKIEEIERKGYAAAGGQREVIVLPSWIVSNTTGILWSEDKPLAVLGDLMLSEGDAIPRYPGVTVHKINKQEVVYSYRGRLFPVEVQGNK